MVFDKYANVNGDNITPEQKAELKDILIEAQREGHLADYYEFVLGNKLGSVMKLLADESYNKLKNA